MHGETLKLLLVFLSELNDLI